LGCFGDQFLRGWELSGIPPATQRFDQLDTRGHLLHAQIHGRLLIAEHYIGASISLAGVILNPSLTLAA
jgi:hypothetical protein